MASIEETSSMIEERTPVVSPGNYSPVTVEVHDTVGAVVLGILSIILLIGWRRSETRYHRLLMQQEKNHESADPA